MTLDAAVPASTIGVDLTRKMSEFEALATRLRAAANGEFDDLIAKIDNSLRKSVAGVSVIGQVKAGKTSLLNGFMGKPEFLPSDVNPWTAVVTNMYFGNPDGPEDGGRFTFFDDTQWKKFASREGRLAELAGSIPGSSYDLSDISAEVEEMRKRAEMRLGEQFQQLLGKSHRFSSINTDILARYICAGDDPEQLVKNPVMGRFADITREASIYFGKERFGYPLRLIDTPGLNDPLLIREEITLQCLEHSDIFVLVLSAHQAFSSADMYLLRVLNALRLDRLVVFVNRCDELTNPIDDIPEIASHIKTMLSRENPNTTIPVIFGSALWAEYAMGQAVTVDPAKFDMFLSGRDAALASAKAVFDTEEKVKAWVASGLPALDDAIAGLMDAGIGESWLQSARVDLGNVSRIVEGDAKRRISALRRQLALMQDQEPPAEDDATETDTRSFAEAEEQIQKMLIRFKVALEATSSTVFGDVQNGLRAVVDNFIKDETKKFRAAYAKLKRGKSTSTYSIDPIPLRAGMNRYFRMEFPIVQTKILAKLEEEAETLATALVELGFEEASDIQVNTVQLSGDTPNTTALSKVVSFDMPSKFWKGWFGKFKSEDEVEKALGKMIRSQFLPIENELLEDATDKLTTASQAAIKSFHELQSAILSTRRGQAQHGAEEVQGSIDELQARLADLEARVALCQEIRQEQEAA